MRTSVWSSVIDKRGSSSSFNVPASPYSWIRIAFIVTSKMTLMRERCGWLVGRRETSRVGSRQSLICQLKNHTSEPLSPLKVSNRARVHGFPNASLAYLTEEQTVRTGHSIWPIREKVEKLSGKPTQTKQRPFASVRD